MKACKGNKVQIRDIALNYYETGNGDVLLFLHGNSLESSVFEKMYNHFSGKYKVVAVDSRGHGLSESGEIPYTIDLLADHFNIIFKKEIIPIIEEFLLQ